MNNIKWNYMMSNLVLSIEDRGGARSTSFSGRREGRAVRKKHNLDEKDKDDNSYVVSMPQDTTSFNPSFFLGLFYQSIKKLGIDEFQKKYIFSYDNLYESLKKVIKNNIDLSITRAKKDLSGMTGLDSYL